MTKKRKLSPDDERAYAKALRGLVEKGLIVDSGMRRKGQIVWIAVPPPDERH